jgi:hypothetical protein
LQIGDLVVHGQTFYMAALPEDAGTPVLIVGYELLRRFAVRVDYERQSLTFYDGPRFHYAGPGTAVPLEIQRNGNGLFVEASIGKALGRFLLDTGNEFGFSLTTGFTEKNSLVNTLGAHFLAYNGRGFGGPSPRSVPGPRKHAAYRQRFRSKCHCPPYDRPIGQIGTGG